MKTKYKLIATGAVCIAALCMAVGVGSVSVSPLSVLKILVHKMFGAALPDSVDGSLVSIIWNIRFPRALCAFLTGGALAASGTVMQSVLKNPLASGYTLGVSSGASLGAALVIVTGFSVPFAGIFTLPLAGFIFGLGTVLLAIGFSARLDRGMRNQTIILVGMVLSLFVNAILTLVSALAQNYMQQLLVWQMGSFSSRGWEHAAVLGGVTAAGTLLLCRYTKEMDIMTFGEEQARAIGVETKHIKLMLIILASLLTGTAVCFTGVIGFVDLIAPHVVRRIFGPSHKLVLPVSVLFGGAFMVLADMTARTLLAPMELPVGAITALIGAPFFAWVYFKGRKIG